MSRMNSLVCLLWYFFVKFDIVRFVCKYLLFFNSFIYLSITVSVLVLIQHTISSATSPIPLNHRHKPSAFSAPFSGSHPRFFRLGSTHTDWLQECYSIMESLVTKTSAIIEEIVTWLSLTNASLTHLTTVACIISSVVYQRTMVRNRKYLGEEVLGLW